MLKRIECKKSLVEKTQPRKDWASSIPFDKVKKKSKPPLIISRTKWWKKLYKPRLYNRINTVCFHEDCYSFAGAGTYTACVRAKVHARIFVTQIRAQPPIKTKSTTSRYFRQQAKRRLSRCHSILILIFLRKLKVEV